MNLVLRLLCTVLPMLVMHRVLHATGPLGFFYGFLAAGCFIPLLPRTCQHYVRLFFFSLGAFIGLALIVIQPLSGFLIWFDLVGSGTIRGPVSAVFMYLGGYLSLAASFGSGPGQRLRFLGQFLFVNALLAFIIVRLGWILALAGVLLPLVVIAALLGKPVPKYRRRGLATLTGLALLAGLITLAPTPRQAPGGMYLIDEYLSGFLREIVFKYLPDFPVLYGFSGYGYGFAEEKLGGRPLLSERALFALEGQAGSTYYLRSKAYDTFTGTGWVNSFSHPDSVPSGRLPEIETEDPGQSGSADTGWQTLLRLNLLVEYYPLVPQILGTTTVLPGRSGDGLVYSGSPAVGLTLLKPLVYGERMRIGRQTSLSAPGVADGVADGQIIAPGQDPADRPEHYLFLPEAVPPVARELAASLIGLPPADFTHALAELLDEGFTYSLDPEIRPGDGKQAGDGNQVGTGMSLEEDGFIHHFLAVSRTGYCVHFASAAVLLARLAGVPARYVTGFLVTIPQPEDYYLPVGSGGLVRTEITGLNSHAWAELWLPSTGWTSFEATPALRMDSATADRQGTAAASFDDYTLRQLAVITGGRVDLREAGNAGNGAALGLARTAIVFLIFLLALLVCAGLYRLARQTDWYHALWLGWWPWPGAGWNSSVLGLEEFSRRAKRIVRLASVLGLPGPEQDGWLAWEEGLAALLARHGVDQNIQTLHTQTLYGEPLNLRVFREVFFGCRPPDSQDFIHEVRLAKQLRSLSRRKPEGASTV